MTRHHITTLLIFAVGVCGSPFSDQKVPSGSEDESTNLGWLFGPTGDHEYAMDQPQEREVCQSDECNKVARALRESIDDSVDPCMDFYGYACGNWANLNPIPKGEVVWNMLTIIQQRVNNLTAGILKEEVQTDDVLPLKLAKKLYKSCMDIDDMDRRGLEPIVITLARSGVWPMILEPDEYDENEMTWQKIDDYYIRLSGQPAFMNIMVRVPMNSSHYMPFITLPYPPVGSQLFAGSYNDSDSTEEQEESEEELGNVPNSQERDSKEEQSGYIEKKEIMIKKRVKHEANDEKDTLEEKKEKYRQFIIHVVTAIAETRGFPVSKENIAQDVDDLIEFIIKMQQLRGFRYSTDVMTIKEFQEWYDSLGYTSKTSKVNWFHKLSIIFDDANVEINENLELFVAEKKYIKKLTALLDKTPVRTIVNYVQWRVCSHALRATTREMRKLVELLTTRQSSSSESEKNKEEDEDEMEERSKVCTREVGATTIIGFEYVKRYFNERTLRAAEEMVMDIREEVSNQIQKCGWMDESTKAFALKKATEMATLVGYPKWYENKTAVNTFYKGLIISPSYFENFINHVKRKYWNSLKLVRQEENIEHEIEPTEVNAFYAPMANTIVITAADLQGPFFDATRPATVNFGIIGLIIGHEINHGFDSDNFAEGMPGSEPGNILIDAYGERAACFVEQFNNYMENLIAMNETIKNYGNQTSGENIADSMGLHAVYHAYKTREQKNGKPEPTLPGFEDFNNDQLFFLSFANMWCESYDEEKAARIMQIDVHSPGRLRVIGSVSNSKEFAQAYNCPVGSLMNPEKKCDIWK